MDATEEARTSQLRLWVGHALLAAMGTAGLAASAAWAALMPDSGALSDRDQAAPRDCDGLACAVLSRMVQADVCVEPAAALHEDCGGRLEAMACGASSDRVMRGSRPVRWHRAGECEACLHDRPSRFPGVAGIDLPRTTGKCRQLL